MLIKLKFIFKYVPYKKFNFTFIIFGFNLKELEEILSSVEEIMEYNPNVMEESEYFHNLALSSWNTYNLFSGIRLGIWGVNAFLLGSSIDISNCN